MSTEAESDQPQSPRKLIEAVGLIATPITIITALAFYFAATRTEFYWNQFGIDTRLLAYSPQDYLLRSIDAMLIPIGALPLFALVGLRAYRASARKYSTALATNPVRWGLVLVGFILVVVAVLQVCGLVISPMLFAIAIALIGLGYSGFEDVSPVSNTSRIDRGVETILARSLVAAVVFATSFWFVADFAVTAGKFRAHYIISNNLRSLPAVTILSKSRLQIAISSVSETEVGDDRSAYRFRYTGLRLLGFANKRYFLLPENWVPLNDPAVVLLDDDTLRVEFIRAKEPHSIGG